MNSLAWVLLLVSLAFLLIAGLRARVSIPAGMAYIRSGMGGQQVFLKGTALLVPGLHHLSRLRLQTYSVELKAEQETSLRTSDLLRIDLDLVVSIRLKVHPQALLAAARAFGQEGVQASHVQHWLDTDFKTVAETTVASRTLEELHQQRAVFMREVGEALAASLAIYGLELVSISLMKLQQTESRYYDQENYLDVKGLALLDKAKLDYSKHSRTQQREAALASKRQDFDAAIQHMDWERKEFVARLEHIRFKAEADAKTEQALEEIQIAKELALEMVQRDVALTRIQTQQELDAARKTSPSCLADA